MANKIAVGSMKADGNYTVYLELRTANRNSSAHQWHKVRALAHRILADLLDDTRSTELGCALYVEDTHYGANVKLEGGDTFERQAAIRLLAGMAQRNGIDEA